MLANLVRQRLEAGEVELPEGVTSIGQMDVEALTSDALQRFGRQALLLRQQ
jgi:hypothetical protein